MVFKNIVIGCNVYGDDIKLHEIEKGFNYKRLTQRYSKLAIREAASPKELESSGTSHGKFDSRGLSFELSQGR
jgi:hypothetical protein